MSKRSINILFILFASQFLTACASYSSSFSCSDAAGASCYPMDEVDRMISNGKIEEFNNQGRGKKCCGFSCNQKKEIYLPNRSLRGPEVNYEDFGGFDKEEVRGAEAL